MKLVGELKEKVEQTENTAEAKEVIEAAGLELTDDEVEEVAGGLIQARQRRNQGYNKPV